MEAGQQLVDAVGREVRGDRPGLRRRAPTRRPRGGSPSRAPAAGPRTPAARARAGRSSTPHPRAPRSARPPAARAPPGTTPAARRRRARARRSAGWYAVWPSVMKAVAQRWTMPVCRSRSRTCQPGQVGTVASGPASAAAAASSWPSRTRDLISSAVSMREIVPVHRPARTRRSDAQAADSWQPARPAVVRQLAVWVREAFRAEYPMSAAPPPAPPPSSAPPAARTSRRGSRSRAGPSSMPAVAERRGGGDPAGSGERARPGHGHREDVGQAQSGDREAEQGEPGGRARARRAACRPPPSARPRPACGSGRAAPAAPCRRAGPRPWPGRRREYPAAAMPGCGVQVLLRGAARPSRPAPLRRTPCRARSRRRRRPSRRVRPVDARPAAPGPPCASLASGRRRAPGGAAARVRRRP